MKHVYQNIYQKISQKVNLLIDKILGTRCQHCGSRKRTHRYNWNRGYNNLCKQSIGDSGWYCNECGKIEWDRSIKDFESNLPDWCKAHDGKFYRNISK